MEHHINKLPPFSSWNGMEMDVDQAMRREKKKDYSKKKRWIIAILRDTCPFICQEEKKVEKTDNPTFRHDIYFYMN